MSSPQHNPQHDPQYDEHPGHGARRRGRRRGVGGPILAALLVLGLLAGGGWYFTQDGENAVPTSQNEPLTVTTDEVRTPPAEVPAPTPTPSAAPPPTPTPTPSKSPSKKPSATPTPTRSTTAPSRRTTRKPSTKPSPSHTSTPKPTTPRPTTTGPTTTKPAPIGGSMETQVLQLTNTERQKAGCGSLKTNSALARAAEDHAADMVDHHYFDHTSQDGRSPFDRMKAAGFRGGSMAENIAVGHSSAAAVVKGWMDSPGHRKNLLNCNYTMIGVGYHSGQVKPDWGNGSWVQNFGA